MVFRIVIHTCCVLYKIFLAVIFLDSQVVSLSSLIVYNSVKCNATNSSNCNASSQLNQREDTSVSSMFLHIMLLHISCLCTVTPWSQHVNFCRFDLSLSSIHQPVLMELYIVESIKCHSFEMNRFDVHFMLSVEKSIVFMVVLSLFLAVYHGIVSVKLDI